MSKHKDFSHLTGKWFKCIKNYKYLSSDIIIAAFIEEQYYCCMESFIRDYWDIGNPLDYNPNNIKQKEEIMEQEYQKITLENLGETLLHNGAKFLSNKKFAFNQYIIWWDERTISLNTTQSKDPDPTAYGILESTLDRFQMFLAGIEFEFGKLKRLPKEPEFDFQKYINRDYFTVPFQWFHHSENKSFRFNQTDKMYLENKHNADIMLKAQELFKDLQLCEQSSS